MCNSTSEWNSQFPIKIKNKDKNSLESREFFYTYFKPLSNINLIIDTLGGLKLKKSKNIILLIISIMTIITTTGCNSVDKVKELMFKEDPDIEFIRSDQDEIKASIETDLRETVVYYENDTGYVVPVKRDIAWEDGIGKAVLKNMVDSVAIREEIAKIGFKPIIPKNTEILGMTINEDTKICTVDFSNDLLNYESKTQEKNIINSIVYTLTEFPNIEEVKITIDGKDMDELKHGTSIEKPLTRKDINLVETSQSLEEGGYSKILVYYKGTNEENYDHYVPVTIPVNSSDIGPEFVVEKLFDKTPENLEGLFTDIPNGVEFKNARLENGTMVLDLDLNDDEILKNQDVIDRMSKNIGLTLNQFDDIENIKLSVKGKILQDTVPAFANEY